MQEIVARPERTSLETQECGPVFVFLSHPQIAKIADFQKADCLSFSGEAVCGDSLNDYDFQNSGRAGSLEPWALISSR